MLCVCVVISEGKIRHPMNFHDNFPKNLSVQMMINPSFSQSMYEILSTNLCQIHFTLVLSLTFPRITFTHSIYSKFMKAIKSEEILCINFPPIYTKKDHIIPPSIYLILLLRRPSLCFVLMYICLTEHTNTHTYTPNTLN